MNRLPVFQNEGKRAYKPGLQRIQNVLDELGNPEKVVRCIHVAGTNGKGTVCHSLSAALQAAGYKVGLFTSPHFISLTERIKVNGENANESFVCDFLNAINWDSQSASYFELLTAMGFQYFKNQAVDVAIIEVGLGGRLDSTNVCHPILSAITNIGLDHCEMLGDTIEKIAVEKAGIKKPGVTMMVAPLENSCVNAIKAVYGADEMHFLNGNPLENNNLPLVQAMLSYLATDFVELKKIDIKKALLNVPKLTGFKGRFQEVIYRNTSFILDVAHNAPALKGLLTRVQNTYGSNVAFIIGVSSDKDIEPVLEFFPKTATYLPVQASVLRAKNAEDLKNILLNQSLNISSAFDGCSVSQSIDYVVGNNVFDAVVITGSFFVVADALKYFQENNL